SYIVYLGGHSTKSSEEAIVNSHHELLGSVMKSKEKAKEAIFYSYTKEINGFAANMEEDEANEISKHPSVLSVFKDKTLKIQTTHSWDFIGLPSNVTTSSSLPPTASSGADVIIGHIDTGVWPESKSFNDDGMGPIPSKWKGICQNQNITNFACNKKLIGARYFAAGFLQGNNSVNDTKNGPRDTVGHGTHTLSTSGGSIVTNVSYFGYANGTARGGAPHARVAMYRVCWRNPVFATCKESDILAGIDAAIDDGVDVLSMSIGGGPEPYFVDTVAIGSFHATNKGIVVVCSAGNSGPDGAISNVAPWIFTVAANTIDRYFPSYLTYDGKRINGTSLSNGLPSKDLYPIISSINASVYGGDDCFSLTMKAKGKIVVCNSTMVSPIDQAVNVQIAGGVGMVLVNSEKQGEIYLSFPYSIPTIHITNSDGQVLQSYITSNNKSAMGLISSQVTSFGNRAPQMPQFSSQGPSLVNKEILKPDVSAPGVQILAAFAGVGTSTGVKTDPLSPFAVMSGTSMSAPHIAGISALLKSQYPTWSPAMIKSAIMTTATIHDNTGQLIAMADPSLTPATPFSYGAGQVNANAVMDPGLVYDLTTEDYLNFLCANDYNLKELRLFSDNYTCPSTPMQIEDLNLPSISIPYLVDGITVTRKLTNVGPPGKYNVSIDFPKNITVTVNPTELDFDKVGEQKVFQVSVSGNHGGQYKKYFFGRLKWSDGKHSVEIPLAVHSLL
ncbi:Tripeptidyl-peptidase II protein, partial [Dioscorea alata]